MTKTSLFQSPSRFLVLLLVLLAPGCDDGDATPAGDADTFDAGANDVSDLSDDTSLADTNKLPMGASCMTHDECQRETSCSGGQCSIVLGCATALAFPPPEEDETACVVDSNPGGLSSAKECDSDEDCAGSVFGDRCIWFACTVAERCTTNDDCTDPEQSCTRQTVCVTDRSQP